MYDRWSAKDRSEEWSTYIRKWRPRRHSYTTHVTHVGRNITITDPSAQPCSSNDVWPTARARTVPCHVCRRWYNSEFLWNRDASGINQIVERCAQRTGRGAHREEKKYRVNTALHFRDYVKPGGFPSRPYFSWPLKPYARTDWACENRNGTYLLVSQAIRRMCTHETTSRLHEYPSTWNEATLVTYLIIWSSEFKRISRLTTEFTGIFGRYTSLFIAL